MKNMAIFTLATTLAFTTPAFAQSQNDENIKSDVQAVNKDNTALQKDNNSLAQDRAAKAADKANGSYGKQAVDSVKIGADQSKIAEKQTETTVDKKILKHHKKATSTDNGDAQTSTTN